MPVNYGQGVPWQTFTYEQRTPKKQSNVVGYSALIAAVIGFICACSLNAIIFSWALLPIAFVLSLISLCQLGNEKWVGITALNLTIFGMIVGAMVFFAGLGDDVALGEGDGAHRMGLVTEAP